MELVVWPYHTGLLDVGIGLGARLLAADGGVRAALEAAGWGGGSSPVPAVDESLTELARVFELVRRLARRAQSIRS